MLLKRNKLLQNQLKSEMLNLRMKALSSIKYLATMKTPMPLRYQFSNKKFTPFSQQNTLENQHNINSTNYAVSKNVGLSRFLQKVYNTTGLSVLASLGTSYAVLSLPITAGAMSTLAFTGIAASLIGLIGSAMMKTRVEVITQTLNSNEKIQILVSRNSMLRKVVYGVGVVGLGLSTAPLIGFANAISPTILPTALGLTIALFGGASLAAYSMPKDSLLSYGRILGGGLLGLIGLQLAGIGSVFFFGANPIATMLMSTTTYMAVGLFTAMIAYDTHYAIKMYEEQLPDHLSVATNFLLDFWNILTSLLRIFSSD